MGNTGTKPTISVRTEETVYEVGKRIVGFVTFRIPHDLGKTQLLVRLRGYQIFKASFEQIDAKASTHGERVLQNFFQTVQREHDLVNIDLPQRCWKNLKAGNYEISFDFNLPSHLPGTFNGNGANILTSFEYKISAELRTLDGGNITMQCYKYINVNSPHTRHFLIKTLNEASS